MSAEKITAVGANIAEKATMIWNVADMLRGPLGAVVRQGLYAGNGRYRLLPRCPYGAGRETPPHAYQGAKRGLLVRRGLRYTDAKGKGSTAQH